MKKSYNPYKPPVSSYKNKPPSVYVQCTYWIISSVSLWIISSVSLWIISGLSLDYICIISADYLLDYLWCASVGYLQISWGVTPKGGNLQLLFTWTPLRFFSRIFLQPHLSHTQVQLLTFLTHY